MARSVNGKWSRREKEKPVLVNRLVGAGVCRSFCSVDC